MVDESLRIGWARTDFTPERPVLLNGQMHVRVSQYTRDPLTATALALEGRGSDGRGAQAIMVSCDLVGVQSEIQERVRALVAPRLPGFDVRGLFLHATHTHTAPVLLEGLYPLQGPEVQSPTACADLFCTRVADAAVRAWEARQPGGVSWALGHAVVGYNRRLAYADGSTIMYGPSDRPDFWGMEGGCDHGVELLYTWDERECLTGVALNVACPTQVIGHKSYISADYWCEARRELRARYGPGLHVYPMIAPAGDQCPPDHVRRGRGLVNDRDEPYLYVVGRRLANAVDEQFVQALLGILMSALTMHHIEELSLPARAVTAQEAEEAQAFLARLEAEDRLQDPRNGFWHARRCRQVLQRYAAQGQSPRFPVELHVLRLGDVVFCTNPFELFLDYGLRIKARSKAAQTFCIQLAGGYAGYLPTARAVPGGGYGAQVASNNVGPEGGQALVDRTLELVNSLV